MTVAWICFVLVMLQIFADRGDLEIHIIQGRFNSTGPPFTNMV